MLLGMRTRVPAVGAIGALVMLAGVVAAGASAVPLGEGRQLFEFLRLPPLTNPVNRVTPQNAPRPAGAGDWPDVLGWVVVLMPVILLGLLLLAALVMAIRRRPRISLPTQQVDMVSYADLRSSGLLRAVHSARAEFDRHEGGPPQDAVIAAWLELESAAAGSGIERQAHQTPTEFTDEVRAGHAAVRGALDELRRLYQRARFGPPGAVGPAQAHAARAALDEIVRALTEEPVYP